MRRIYTEVVSRYRAATWYQAEISWIDGWDLLREEAVAVPTALVDTCYLAAPPHAPIFPRTTTGLASGASMHNAVVKAGLEILERDAIANAKQTWRFFEECRVEKVSTSLVNAAAIVQRIRKSGFVVGIWRPPTNHSLPVYWCQVMESGDSTELAPLPASGYGCDLTHDSALTEALLEACQARLTAISGAREDLTRDVYPETFDRSELRSWRHQLQTTTVASLVDQFVEPVVPDRLSGVVAALKAAGAKAIIVVPLLASTELGAYVVRMIAPPLRQDPGA
jgi:ribosomal protein S12 methylthiotransferase accessory factor